MKCLISALLHDLLFPDDCALLAYSQGDLQCILYDFARDATHFVLVISIREPEVMFQPRSELTPHELVIKISD